MFLFTSVFLGTLAGGFFWTGFPIFFQATQESTLSLASIYVFATLGSLIFSLVGGYLSDIFDFRKISAVSNLLSFFLISLIFLLMSATNQDISNIFVLLLLPLLYFNFALSEASESVWILKSTGQERLRARFFDRMILSFTAKLMGFFFGPILFTQLQYNALIICLTLFFLSSLIQIILAFKETSLTIISPIESNVAKKITLKNVSLLMKDSYLLISILLTGALSVPFSIMVACYLNKIAQPIDISIFWGLGGGSAILGMLVLRKIKIQDLKIALPISLGLLFTLNICFLTRNSMLVILASSVYILLNTFFTAQVRLQLIENAEYKIIGSTVGVLNFLIDTGVFLGMLLISTPLLQHHIFIVIVFSLLVLLRYASFVRKADESISVI